MSRRQRERAMRRAARRLKGNRPLVRAAGGDGYDEYHFTPTGRAMLQSIRDKVAAGVPVDQLGEHERLMLEIADMTPPKVEGIRGTRYV